MILHNWCAAWVMEEWAEARVWMDHCSIGARVLAHWHPTDPVHIAMHALFSAYMRRSVRDEASDPDTAQEVLDVAQQLGPKWTRMPGYFTWLMGSIESYWRGARVDGAGGKLPGGDGGPGPGRDRVRQRSGAKPARMRTAQRALTDAQRLVLVALREGHAEGRGQTARELMVKLRTAKHRISEGQVRRVLSRLRQLGYGIGNARNGAGYLLVKDLP